MENAHVYRATQDLFIDDPREDFDAVVTGKRRKGTLARGACTACGWSSHTIEGG